jgi:signal transduction histidine kinase
LNLMRNATQAMDGRGKIAVTTSPRKVSRFGGQGPGSDRMSRSGEPENEFVEVSVRDSGPGISQKVLKNLFVPFFTTKTEGTGLGLAISQSIVQNAGGTIDVQTQPGAGTTFTILLPAAPDALSTPVPSAAGTSERPVSAF